MRLHANKRFVRTEAADKNADHSNYVSTIGLCAFNERMQMSTMSWADPRAYFRPWCNYCGLGRDFITQKINSMILPPPPLHCLFCKNNPLRFFFIFRYYIFFPFLLRPLALLFKSAIAISFYLIIDVRTPHVFRIFPRTKIQYFIIIKKEDLTYAFGWKRKGSRGNITLRVVWIKLWRHDEKGCNIFGNRRSVVRHNSMNRIIFKLF